MEAGDDNLFYIHTDSAAGKLAVSVCDGPCAGRGGENGKFKNEHDEKFGIIHRNEF